MSEYNRHKFAMEWMHGGGRDPNGRSLDEEIRIGKDEWMERQRVAGIGTGAVIPEEFDELSPREQQYYQQGPFSTHPDFLGAKGGSAQLVQPGPGRPGYSGNQIYNPQWYKAQKKLDQSRIANPSDEAMAEINKIIDEITLKENDILGKKVKHLPQDVTIEKLAKKVKTKGYTRPSVSKELLKRVLEAKQALTYDNYRTNKIVTVLNDALTKNKGNTLYIKPSAAVELLPEFEVKNVKGGGGNSMLKTYRNYISGGELIGSRAGVVVPEEIGGRKIADIVTDLDRNFLDVKGGKVTGNMKILNEVRLLDQLANENPKVSAAQLKELFEEAGGTKFKERLKFLMPAKSGQSGRGSAPLILEAVKEGSISNSMPDSLRKSYTLYAKDYNISRFMADAEMYRKTDPEKAYRYTKASNLLQKNNLERLGISGAAEHALPRSAIKTANAHPDTRLKIDAFIDPELNNWKAKNFDEAIFSPNRLADKYNKATDPKVKAALQEEIMQRLDFMKKRAPELMEKVTFDFSGGKFTASSSTATLDVADDVAMKGLFEKGNRINQKFITEMPDAVKLTSTGRIASIDDKFIKPIVKQTKLVSFPANLADVKLGKAVKGWRGGALFEILFGTLDYWNEQSKGKEGGWGGQAMANAIQNATFGMLKTGDKKYVHELLRLGKEMGFDTTALEHVIDINKRDNVLAKVEAKNASHLEAIKKQIDATTDPEKKEELQEIYNERKMIFATRERLRAEETDKIFNTYIEDLRAKKAGPPQLVSPEKLAATGITQEEANLPFEQLWTTAMEQLGKEKTKAFPEASKRLDYEAGVIGDPLQTHIFNVPAWTKEHELWGLFNPTPLQQERTHLNSLIKLAEEGNPQPLKEYNERRGVYEEEPITQQSLINLTEQHPWLGYRIAEASGGIADLLKK